MPDPTPTPPTTDQIVKDYHKTLMELEQVNDLLKEIEPELARKAELEKKLEEHRAALLKPATPAPPAAGPAVSNAPSAG